jgi:phage head maturation protease
MSFAFQINNTKSVVTTVEGVTVADLGGERITIRREGEKTIEERELLDLDLFDVSPVTYAQYESTDVALRSLGERREKEFQGKTAGRRSSRLMGMRLRLAEARLK